MILSGNAAAEILRLSREGSFDLIVLSTRGRGALTRLVLGSVADRVVRESVCPVLVVQQPARA
jgi:nucleotide-binding universal stress UspA family protein